MWTSVEARAGKPDPAYGAEIYDYYVIVSLKAQPV